MGVQVRGGNRTSRTRRRRTKRSPRHGGQSSRPWRKRRNRKGSQSASGGCTAANKAVPQQTRLYRSKKRELGGSRNRRRRQRQRPKRRRRRTESSRISAVLGDGELAASDEAVTVQSLPSLLR